MEMVYWVIDPMIAFIAALRITPNMVTLASLVPAAAGGGGHRVRLLRPGRHADRPGRRSATSSTASWPARWASPSDAGEVVDAAVDRYGEMFFFGGLVYYYREHDQVLFIVLAALVGSFMVSYATAKAEAMGVPRPRAAPCAGPSAPPT